METIEKELKENGFNNARMISSSKSSYHEKHPNNVVFFNANIIDKKFGKCFYGDLDLTLDAPVLTRIAKELKTTFYVLSEMDGRFDNENKKAKELIKKAKWNTEMFVPIYDKDWKIVDKRQLEIDCREATK